MTLLGVAFTSLVLANCLWADTVMAAATPGRAVRRDNITAPESQEAIRWQPDDFDWEHLRNLSGPPETWRGVYVDPTQNKHAAAVLGSGLVHYQAAPANGTSTTDLEVLPKIRPLIGVILGLNWSNIWATAGLGALIASSVTLIQGCIASAKDEGWGTASCVTGLAASITSIGQTYSTIRTLYETGWFVRPDGAFLFNGLANILVHRLHGRGLADASDPDHFQAFHEIAMGHLLNHTYDGSAEFLGHAGQGHRLHGRDDEHRHPRAPIFRVRHPRHGYMDIASRDHVNGTRFTMTYANGLEHKRGLDRLGRRATFQHQTERSGVIAEAHFDAAAAAADSCQPTFVAKEAFPMVEDSINCFVKGKWPDHGILSVQFFDTSCEDTMGFAHVGFFKNDDGANALQKLRPAGMPLPVCGS